MDSTKVIELIEKGEGLNLEFKTSFNVACIETLVAFANTKGGRVLIGVSNSGKVVGVDITEESVQHWVNEIKGKTEPSIIPDVEVIGVEGKNVVSLGVNEFPVKSNDYTSQTRNKLVAKAFKEVGLVERYGSGIRRITDICKNYGMPEPYFENMEMGFKVVLYKKVDNSNMDDVNPPVNPINPPVNPPENPINPPVNTLDSKILQLIVENSNITYDELAKITNKNRDTIRKHIGYLQSKGYITRIGSAKTGYWRVN